MLEFLVIRYWAGAVGDIAARKGYNGSLFAVLFGGLWFVGEALGLVVGLNMDHTGSGPNWLAAIPLALAFALFGAFIGFMIALVLPAPSQGRKRRREKEFDIYGNPIVDEDERDRRARRRRRRKDEVLDDYQPRQRRRQEEEEPEEYRPRQRRAEVQDEDQPRPRRRPVERSYRDYDD